MPMRIVEFFEMIDIEHQQAKRRSLALELGAAASQLGIEGAAIGGLFFPPRSHQPSAMPMSNSATAAKSPIKMSESWPAAIVVAGSIGAVMKHLVVPCGNSVHHTLSSAACSASGIRSRTGTRTKQ